MIRQDISCDCGDTILFVCHRNFRKSYKFNKKKIKELFINFKIINY